MDGKSFDHLFDQISTIDVDPYIMRTSAQARELEALLNNSPGNEYDDDELAALVRADTEEKAIEAMDAECPHMDKVVLVTGTIKRAYYDELTEKFTLEDVVVTGMPVYSKGYTTLEFVTDDNEPTRRVGHLFLTETLPPRNDTPALVDYIPRLYAFAPVGEVEIQFTRDEKDAFEFLMARIPDVLAEIEQRIVGTSRECDALLSLADHAIRAKQDIPNDVLSVLLTYVNNRLNLDKKMPYRAQVAGIGYDDTDVSDDSYSLTLYEEPAENSALLVSPTSLRLRPYPYLVDGKVILTDELYWCLEADILGRNIGDENQPFCMPIRNILNLKSLREIVLG